LSTALDKTYAGTGIGAASVINADGATHRWRRPRLH